MVDLAKDSTAPSPRTVYLKDYEPAAYLIEDVQLRFELELVSLRRGICTMNGQAFVDGKLTAEAELSSVIVER